MVVTRITGTGSYIPPDIVTNDDLSHMVETSDEWIRTRTGIRNRHIAKNMDNSDMAACAARSAIENAGIDSSDIGLIIAATSTPDYSFPNLASLVQSKVGIKDAVCFDISAACTGFITALDIADAMLKKGTYGYALVIGSEKMSGIVNWKDRNVCVLFGDGAGAVILQADNIDDAYTSSIKYISINNVNSVESSKMSETVYSGHIIDSDIHNDANKAMVLTGGRKGIRDASDAYIHMNGQEVFRFAVRKVPETIETLLRRNNLKVDDISRYILHQANVRIIEAVAKRLGVDIAGFPVNIGEYGNTSSASIPILLDELNQQGELKKNDKLVLAGFGAGLSWGSVLLEW